MRTVLSLGVAVLLGICSTGWVVGQDGADLVVKTGDAAPDFTATTTTGEEITLDSFKDADVVVLTFTCNSCPVAIAYEDRFNEFVENYKDKKVVFVAINNHKSEDLAAMKQRAEEKGFGFVYAYEPTGESARAYGAKVTPHCFVLDKDRNVVYQGAFAHYVADAVDALLAGKTVEVSTTKAFGCGIKFRDAGGTR